MHITIESILNAHVNAITGLRLKSV